MDTEAHTSKVADLQERLRYLQEDLEQYKKRTVTAEAKVTDLTDQLSSTERNLHAAEHRAATLESSEAALREAVFARTSDADTLKDTLRASKAQLRAESRQWKVR